MKIIPILIFSFFSIWASIMAQQSTISGVVSIHNSQIETGTRQYVQLATVKDSLNRAQQVLTSKDGGFSLTYINVPNGTSLQMIIAKEGLKVVNTDELKAVLGQLDLARISMATPQKIKELSESIYNKGYTNASRKYSAEIKATKEQINHLVQYDKNNRQEIVRLQDRLVRLENQRDRLEDQIEELTRRYVQINLDDASPLYVDAFNLFQEGRTEEALNIISGTLEKLTVNYFSKKNQTDLLDKEVVLSNKELAEERPKLIKLWQLKADIYTYNIHPQLDSAEYCYQNLFQLDSNNLTILKDYGIFKSEILDFESAIRINKKLLSKNPMKQDSAAYLNDLGNYYKYIGVVDSALFFYGAAIKAYDELFKKTNDELYYYRIGSSYNNAGGIFSRMGEYQKAKRCFRNSISIYFKLKNANDRIIEELGFTSLNLGTILTAQDSIEPALKFLSNAKIFFTDLAARDTSNFDYVFQIANSYGLIAQAYREADSLLLSLNNYMKSDSIFNKIYNRNAFKYGFEYGRMLMGFSVLMNKFEKEYHQKILIDSLPYSEHLMIKAISIFQKITNAYPRQFASEYSQILRNASDLFFQNEKYKDALRYSEEGIQLIEGLYVKTKQDSINLAIEYSKFSFLQYKINKNYHDAVLLLEKSFAILDSLSVKDPKHQSEKFSLFEQYTWFLILDGQFSKAEFYSRKNIEVNPNKFYSLSNLGHALLLQKKFEEAKAIFSNLYLLNNEQFASIKSDILLFKKIGIIDAEIYNYFNQNILKID